MTVTIFSAFGPSISVDDFRETVVVTFENETHKVGFYGPRSSYDQAQLRNRARKTRVHVWGEDLVDFSDLPSGWQYNDDPAIKKAVRAKNKIELANMNEVRLEALPLFEAAHHEELATQKLRFSRYAGCSCGCSPGFIADRLIVLKLDGQQPLYIESIHVQRKKRG